MESKTIAIGSLASVIGLYFLKIILNSKGFKFDCHNKVFRLSGRVGQSSTRSSSVDDNNREP